MSTILPFLFAARCTSDARLVDKTAIITGASSGIGRATAKDFYQRGCRVIMASKDTMKGDLAAEEIKAELQDQEDCGELLVMELDLSSLHSVRTFAKKVIDEEPELNILVNNAGVMLCPLPLTLSEDGVEMHFATNYLGHFLLTLLLLPRLIKSAPSRIVMVVSSTAKDVSADFADVNWAKTPYDAGIAYCRSKLACLIFMKELARQLVGKNVNVYAVHPGWVRTDLDRHLDSLFFSGFRTILGILLWLVMKSPEQGAQTQIHCAVDEEAGESSGEFYEDCQKAEFPVAVERRTTEALWIRSTQMVKYHGNPFIAG